MRYVLDTNIVSAVMRPDLATVGRLAGHTRADVGIPQPVIAEIRYGLERLPRSKRRDLLMGRFDDIRHEITAIMWTDAVSEAFGVVKTSLERIGRRLEDFDIAIAAHALAYGAILVTANVEQMGRVPGLVIEDWSAPE